MNDHRWGRGWKFAVGIAAAVVLGGGQAMAEEVSLARIDCGAGVSDPIDVSRFSDTYAFETNKLRLTVSCYLVRHGDQVMIWDTGYPTPAPGTEPGPRSGKSLVDALAKVELTPAQVTYVGASHYHGDHIGQVASFPGATLLIGKADWDVLTTNGAPGAANPKLVEPWLGGDSKVEPVVGDKDVFGDGSVVMLSTPGHTPGHHSLLVRLKEKGPVLLTGDLAHLEENYENNGVPSFNTDRADTLASLDRFKNIAKNLGATVIIQHDPRHLDRLPAFPKAAR